MVNLKKTAGVEVPNAHVAVSNVRHMPSTLPPSGRDLEQILLSSLEGLLGKSLRTVRFVPETICQDATAQTASLTHATPSELARIVRDLVRNKDEQAVHSYILDQLQKKVDVARQQATLHRQTELGQNAIYRKQLDDLRGDVLSRFGLSRSDIDEFIEEGLRQTTVRVTELLW